MVEVDEDSYHRGVEQLKFNVVGRLSVQRRDAIPTTLELKQKLVEGLDIVDMKVIPMSKGVFHVLLYNLSDQCNALTVGSLFLKPRVMGFNRWMPGCNISIQMQTTMQVCIRLLNVPLKFRKARIF